MTFLPIIERELRVTARRKSTYRLRVWTAVVAIMAAWGGLVSLWVSPRGALMGSMLFSGLTSYALGLCLLAGLFLTADCISAEKREGTLGLLFLTKLNGYDVLLGKFLAVSLNAFFGLFALLPVLGIPLLMGGVTGGEFARMSLALVNALFVSLAVGMFASVLAREASTGMEVTFILGAGLVVGMPAVAVWAPRLGLGAKWAALAWASPICPFGFARESAYAGHFTGFWWGLVASHSVAWGCLALAACFLPRCWQERPDEGSAGMPWNWLKLWRRIPQREDPARTRRLLTSTFRGATEARSTFRNAAEDGSSPTRSERSSARKDLTRVRLLEVNPVLWWLCRDGGTERLAWAIVFGWGFVMMAVALFLPRDFDNLIQRHGLPLVAFGFKSLIAVQSCRFFAQGRRDGMLEALLCTPLKPAEIVRGQSLALNRTFAFPIGVLACFTFLAPCLIAVSAPSSWSSNLVIEGITQVMAWGLFVLRMALDFFAISWFGRWLALTVKRPGFAAALTVLWVLILPSVPCFPTMLADLIFIAWGSSWLSGDWRSVLSKQFDSVSRGGMKTEG